jgi:hypothetical protein
MLILARVINRGLYWQTPKVTSSVSLASDVNKWLARGADFFYPDPIVRETAERIPQATLRLYDGSAMRSASPQAQVRGRRAGLLAQLTQRSSRRAA